MSTDGKHVSGSITSRVAEGLGDSEPWLGSERPQEHLTQVLPVGKKAIDTEGYRRTELIKVQYSDGSLCDLKRESCHSSFGGGTKGRWWGWC